MRKSLTTGFILFITVFSASAQSTIDSDHRDTAAAAQKFFLPVSSYHDSAALARAMPSFAEQVSAVYHDNQRKDFFENSVTYFLLAANYKMAQNMIDSVRKIEDDPSWGIDVSSYVAARIAENNIPGSFELTFKNKYQEGLKPLTFRKKAYLALFDSAAASDLKTQYNQFADKLKTANKDSLSLDDARSLCDKYFYYTVYEKIYPLMASLTGAQYKPTFPAIKRPSWAGVVPVETVDEKTDPAMRYKLLMELTGFAYKGQDSTAKKEINAGLGTVARQLNLHEASGIPHKNIDVVVVIHGNALLAFLTNEKYKKKYGIDNPNIELIKELQAYGAKMVVCGQAMTFFRLEMNDLVPGIKQALSAQTVLSTYQSKNYVHYDLSLTDN